MSFLRFPGVAGSYISTPDVNLNDADTAHLQQGKSTWIHGGNGSAFTRVLADGSTPSSLFGDYVGYVTATTTSTPIFAASNAPGQQGRAPVVAGTTYTAIAATACPDAVGSNVSVSIRWKDEAAATISVVAGTSVPATAEMQYVSLTAVAPAGAVWAGIQIGQATPASSEKVWLSNACVREGTDTTFVPSMNIVGLSYVVVDPTDMQGSYTPGVEFQIGDGWAGDGISVVARDGIGGPIVAEFQVSDIGIEEGVVPPGTQWQDTTGRTWTSSGSLEILDWLYGYPVEDLAAYLDAALPHGVQVYSHAADIGKLPAVVLVPGNPAIALTTMAGAEMTLAWGIEATLVVNRSQPLYGTRLLFDLWRQIATACIAYSETVQVLTLEEIGTVEWSGGEALAGTMPMILTQSEGT